MEYLIGAVAMWFVVGFFTMIGESASAKTDKRIHLMFSLPILLLQKIILILCYPIAFIWQFTRCAIKGIDNRLWLKTKKGLPKIHLFNNYYACYDRYAEHHLKKLFLVRVRPME